MKFLTLWLLSFACVSGQTCDTDEDFGIVYSPGGTAFKVSKANGTCFCPGGFAGPGRQLDLSQNDLVAVQAAQIAGLTATVANLTSKIGQMNNTLSQQAGLTASTVASLMQTIGQLNSTINQQAATIAAQQASGAYFSCKALQTAFPLAPSGYYAIQTRSAGTQQLYCDMTTNGATLQALVSLRFYSFSFHTQTICCFHMRCTCPG
eukprot:TRINITY_DN1921_c0_g1_i2.p1 TRINITY_DN1921_c0_g1~~TRINITY_DN1921_c0_g1_i2.p1  ORF type:complete len:219 (+),score=23.91 TRINITY_DN1921_c0_g1_i2:41-658(+)